MVVHLLIYRKRFEVFIENGKCHACQIWYQERGNFFQTYKFPQGTTEDDFKEFKKKHFKNELKNILEHTPKDVPVDVLLRKIQLIGGGNDEGINVNALI